MPADTFTPDIGQQIDEDGRVTYDFDAHVHARGVDLDAAPSTSDAPDDRKVRWISQADGSVVADITGYDLGNFGEVDVTAYSGSQGAIARLNADDRARITAIADDLNADRVEAAVTGQLATVITEDGESSFVQVDPLFPPAEFKLNAAGRLQTPSVDGQIALCDHSLEFVWGGAPLTGQLDVYIDGTFVGSLFPT